FETRLNTEATAEMVLGLNPDAVVIATGSRPNRLEIPGGPAALTVHELLSDAQTGGFLRQIARKQPRGLRVGDDLVGEANDAGHVVIFDREGSNRPLVAADYLSSHGVKVDFITTHPQVSGLGDGMLLEEMIVRLMERGVEFHPGVDLVCY